MARFFQILGVPFPTWLVTTTAPNPDPGAFWADSFWHPSFNSNAFWF